MRMIHVAATTLLATVVAVPVYAGDAKVNFQQVEDYTDFEPASGVEERYQKRRMEELTSYFNELASELPETHQLNVTVTDIDLTGRLEPTFGETASQYIRVVRSIDYPAMQFSYQLTGRDGAVVKEEEVDLKDMSFDFDSMASKYSRTDALHYEKKMLKSWFRKTFSEHLATNQPAESA